MARPSKGTRLELNEFGIWEIRWSEKGRSKRVSTNTKDRKTAEKVLGAWLLEEKIQEGSSEPTIHGILEDYWEEHAKNIASKGSVEKTIWFFQQHFSASVTVSSIDAKSIEGYCKARRKAAIPYKSLTEEPTPGKSSGRKVVVPAKDGTIRHELGVLASAINHAVRNKRLKGGDVPYIPMPAEPPAKDRWLTKDEFQRLRDACSDDRHTRMRLFIYIAINTASRKEAIETLRCSQVDLEHRLIRLNPSDRAQTNKRRPTLPISDELYPILDAAIKSKKPDDFVLGHGGKISPSFNRAAARAGLEGVTPHTLRHTWATWAARAGKSLWEIAGVLGDTVATVEKKYAHHCPDHLRDVINFRAAEKPDEKQGIKPDPRINNVQHVYDKSDKQTHLP